MDSDKAVALQKLCIGCCIARPAILNDKFFQFFDPKSFIYPEWEDVFIKCVNLYKNTRTLDYITISAETNLDISIVSSLEYYMNSILPDVSLWKTYFEALIRLKQRHDIVQILEKYRTMLVSQQDIGKIVPQLTQDILGLEVNTGDMFSHTPSTLTSLHMDSDPVYFGIDEIDHKLSYLGRGKLVIIGGRPGWGKSILAQQSIVAHANAGYQTCLFSFEMSQTEVDRRLLSIASGTPIEYIKSGDFTDDGTLNRIYNSFWIFDKGEDIDCYSVCSQIEALHGRNRLQSVFFDYLQMAVTGGINRKQSLSAYSRALKKLASRTGINVFLLAQLNRYCVAEGRRPNLHTDISECDNIMQDADLGIAIYPNSSSSDASAMRKIGESYVPTSVFDVQKYRDGKPFQVVLANDFQRVRFTGVQ